MYKIIGTDQKEYGPVSAEQIHLWIAEGRVNAQTKVMGADGADWKALADVPEFADVLESRVPPMSAAPPVTAAKTSGMAIASLVLGILGFCGVTAIAGLILGIVATVKIGKSQGRLTGKGLAIAGICVSGFMLLFSIPVMAALMLPALSKAKARAQTIQCVNNLKQLALAVRMYSVDHDELLPPAKTWCDAVGADLPAKNVFQCPVADQNQQCHYAFNAKLGGINETNISPETVLLFETSGGWNLSGGPELMLAQPRHDRGVVVALADGSVQQIKESQLGSLRWDP